MFTGGGALAQQLQSVLTPITKGVIGKFGSVVTRYTKTETRRADNSTAFAWAAAGAGSIAITFLSAERKIRQWGSEVPCTAEAQAPLDLGLAAGDGILVTAGPYTGRKFLVSALHDNAIGGITTVALAPTAEAFE